MSDCYVYVIGHSDDTELKGPVKVGVSHTPERRAHGLSAGNPKGLCVFEAFALPCREAAFEVEKAFHTVHKGAAVGREWFDLGPVDAVRSLACAILSVLVYAAKLSEEEFVQCCALAGIDRQFEIADAITARKQMLGEITH